MATFITAQSVGEDIYISVQTSTEYWKYNHNGSDSSVFGFGNQTITVANANGEFTIIPCLSDGTVSGNITQMLLQNNQITSFDGTGLSSLTYLTLEGNQITSFDGTDLSSLVNLYLDSNQLTSFDGTGLTSLNELYLNTNQITSFDGTGLSSLTDLRLNENQLTSFDGTGLTSLTILLLSQNQLTSFDGTDLTSLINLGLMGNQLTSLDVSPMVSLTNLPLVDSYGTLTNPMTAASNNSILSQLDNNGVENGTFFTINGRTSAGTADYDALIAKGWNLLGLDLPTPPPSGNGKLRIKGVNSGGGTTTTTTTIPSSLLFTNITLGGTISFGSISALNKTTYYRQLTFDYDPTVLAANMDEGSTYEIVMITTSNYFSENSIAGISSMDIGGTTYYRGNAHKVGVQGVGAKGSVTILTAQWSNSNPNTLIVDTPNNVVGYYTPFTLTTWRFALIKDGNYVNGTLSSQSFLGSELDAFQI